MSYDWFDLNRTDIWDFVMVSPQSLDQTYGTLQGVLLDDVSITADYYTDARTSASIKIRDDGQYIPYSFIRIIHRIPEWSYENEIGTYIVSANPSEYSDGAWITSFTLGSQLDKAAFRLGNSPWTVSGGANALTALRQMMENCGFAYTELAPNDYKVNSTFVYETGESFLSRFYDLSNLSNNRLDVNGHGVITISKYIAPKQRPAMYRLGLNDPHGIILNGVSVESDYINTPNECIVAYRFTYEEDDETYEAEMRSSARTTTGNSKNRIGYVISDFYEVTDADDVSQEYLDKLANTRLESLQNNLVEWSLTCKYLPVWEGDIIELFVDSGPNGYSGSRHCLVKSVTIHPKDMTMNLTLKETNGVD